MLIEAFKTTGGAMAQIFLLGALGYFLVRKSVVSDEGLSALSRLTLDVTLPLLIVYQLVKDFSFSKYADWWFFPLLSIGITCVGLAVGWLMSFFFRDDRLKTQFISLVGFQNSGYLPIALFAALLPPESRDAMFIYLFLFLTGFNLLMFSLGAHMLASPRKEKINPGSFLSPPVVATLAGLLLVFSGISAYVPESVLKPMKMVGDCTVPLALFVVGGNLAQIRLRRVNIKAVSLLILAKLIVLPAAGLLLVCCGKVPHLIGLLLLVELAVPSATTLSVLVRHYKKEDVLISQGIFFGHLASMVTLPVFLSIYFTLCMVK